MADMCPAGLHEMTADNIRHHRLTSRTVCKKCLNIKRAVNREQRRRRRSEQMRRMRAAARMGPPRFFAPITRVVGDHSMCVPGGYLCPECGELWAECSAGVAIQEGA